MNGLRPGLNSGRTEGVGTVGVEHTSRAVRAMHLSEKVARAELVALYLPQSFGVSSSQPGRVWNNIGACAFLVVDEAFLQNASHVRRIPGRNVIFNSTS